MTVRFCAVVFNGHFGESSDFPEHPYNNTKLYKIHHIKVFYRTMIFWFFTAAMIESFNLWRWNYGPYKEPVNHAGHSGELNVFKF